MRWFRLCHNESEILDFLKDVSQTQGREIKSMITLGDKPFPFYVSYREGQDYIGFMPLTTTEGDCSKEWYERSGYVHYPVFQIEILT